MSKNTKTVLFRFMPYECTALEEFLEKEASKGWIITEIKGSFIKFKRTEPKTLKFTVDLLEDIKLFDNKNNEVILDYREYCEEAGWKYVCGRDKVQIFYTEDLDGIIPIHTDEKEKFNQIVKVSTWNVISFAIISILFMVNLYQSFSNVGMLKNILSSNIFIISTFIILEVAVFYLVEMISFIKWVIKGRKNLRKNKFTPYNSYSQLKNKNIFYKVEIILALIYVFALPIIGDRFTAFSLISFFILFLIFNIVFYIIVRFLKKKEFKKKNKIIISVLTFIIMYVILLAFTVFNLSGISGDNSTNNENVSPLTLYDFGYETSSVHPYSSKGIVAEHSSYIAEGDKVSLYYEVFRCNNNWIFNKILNKELNPYPNISYEHIDTNLPEDVIVYYHVNDIRKNYIISSENKYVVITNDFEELSQEEFLDIVYKNLFAK